MWNEKKCGGIGCHEQGILEMHVGNYSYWTCWNHMDLQFKRKLNLRNRYDSLVWFRYQKVIKNLRL